MLERWVYHIFPIWIEIWGHMLGGSSWGRTLIIKLTYPLLYPCMNHPSLGSSSIRIRIRSQSTSSRHQFKS